MKRAPNAFTRPKYIACLEKHICDHAKIWIRRGIICEGLEVAREQKAKSLELKVCVSIYDLYQLRHTLAIFVSNWARFTTFSARDSTPRI